METKICPVCEQDKPIEKFDRNLDGSIRKHVCKACYGKKERAKLKLDAIKAFGDKCQCCGEAHPYFLTLDHVQNNGALHRQEYNEQQIYREARREGWPRDKYQLLCMNCNFAKGHFKECPHKLNITVEDALKELNDKCFLTGKKYRLHNTLNLAEARKNIKPESTLSNLEKARQKLAENRFMSQIQNLTTNELEQLIERLEIKQ